MLAKSAALCAIGVSPAAGCDTRGHIASALPSRFAKPPLLNASAGVDGTDASCWAASVGPGLTESVC